MHINRDLTFYESDCINPPLTKGTKVELLDRLKDDVPVGKIAVAIKGVLGYVELPADCISE